MTSKQIVMNLSGMYGIRQLGGLKYDGLCGNCLIYKTAKKDNKGRYLTLLIERDSAVANRPAKRDKKNCQGK